MKSYNSNHMNLMVHNIKNVVIEHKNINDNFYTANISLLNNEGVVILDIDVFSVDDKEPVGVINHE